MVTYKFWEEENKYHGVCTAEKFEHQVQKAIFCFDGMQDTYNNIEDNIDDPDPSFSFDFGDYDVEDYDVAPHDSVQHLYQLIDDIFYFGKNMQITLILIVSEVNMTSLYCIITPISCFVKHIQVAFPPPAGTLPAGMIQPVQSPQKIKIKIKNFGQPLQHKI
jgi:hypothetical protein